MNDKVFNFFKNKRWEPFDYQIESWNSYLNGFSGIINAPTGSGKTYAGFLGALIEELETKNKKSLAYSSDFLLLRYKYLFEFFAPTTSKDGGFTCLSSGTAQSHNKVKGLKVIWITPLRALTNDIAKALQEACDLIEVDWRVEVRSGDTSYSVKKKQLLEMPDVLVTTPESMHVIFAQNGYKNVFKNLRLVVVDEWHELIGSKRGVQTELVLSRLKKLADKQIRIWGISATIGNLDEALKILLGNETTKSKIIKSNIEKELEIETIFPARIETFSWIGHLGISLLRDVIRIIDNHTTTLIFTNTRSQTEIWHQNIIELRPDLKDKVAVHHGSVGLETRIGVEQLLSEGKLKAVVCTSSLDLGVDFRPVETIVQVGSPKGISRFLQRAGRSGHRPGEVSKIYFVPTHSLEILESSALKEAIKNKVSESRFSIKKPLDVLIQYLITLAVSDGFYELEILDEVKSTFAYSGLTKEEWEWCIKFITTGGESLKGYSQYSKVVKIEDLFKVEDKSISRRHKLSIGTIVSDETIRLQYIKGGSIGSVEESFVSMLKPGDTFWFSGKNLEFVRIKEMVAYVKSSHSGKGIVPSWYGGRMPLSSQLSWMIRYKLQQYIESAETGDKRLELDIELKRLAPLLDYQNSISRLPSQNELLVETLKSEDGYHIFIYPFEGRTIHEGLSALIAYRISKLKPISFTFAMNDYGFELLSDNEFRIDEAMLEKLFTTENLEDDILKSVNSTEMAKRKFRDIARISGLVFTGYPGEKIPKAKHLQVSAELLFEVFKTYDPDNLLVKQAYIEALTLQLDIVRIKSALSKIKKEEIKIIKLDRPSPFCFPIIVDSLRDRLSSETIEDRIKKMQMEIEN